LALDPDSVQLILQAIRNVVTAPPPGGQVLPRHPSDDRHGRGGRGRHQASQEAAGPL